MKKTKFWFCLLTSAFLSAPLVAEFYLGCADLAVRFVRLTQILPGSVVMLGIDPMVAAIRSLDLGDTAETAKTAKIAEPTIAVVMFFAGGRFTRLD